MSPQRPCAHAKRPFACASSKSICPFIPSPSPAAQKGSQGLRNEPGVPCRERREILRLETNGSFLWAFGDHWLQTLDGLTVQAMVEEGVLESDMDSQVLLEGNL